MRAWGSRGGTTRSRCSRRCACFSSRSRACFCGCFLRNFRMSFLGIGSVRASEFTLAGLRALDSSACRVVVDGRNFVTRPRPRVATMQSYYEKNSPRAQRSVTLIIPHANTPLGQIGPVPSSPPSSPASVQSELEYTASALILLWFLGRGGRRPTSTTRNSARGRSPRRRSAPTSSH